MASPPLDTRGRATLDDARSPEAIDITTVTRSGKLITDVVRPERHGAWDVFADSDLQGETRSQLPAVRTVPGTELATKQQRRAMKLTQKALALRAQDWTVRDIAAELGVTPATVTGWFSTHRRQVDEHHIDAMLDSIAVPLATENLIHGLIAGDKTYTIKTLEGRGKFRKHADGDGRVTKELPELRIVFEAHGGPSADSTIAGGRILGSMAMPKAIDGQVVSSHPLPHAVQIPGAPSETRTADPGREIPTVGVGSLGVGNPSHPVAGAGDAGEETD